MGRLWENIAKADPHEEGSCWLWSGTVQFSNGYGYLWIDGKNRRVHRVMWEAIHGQIPAGMCVLHACDVRCCVNPAHLWLGSKADNNHDRDAKGRHGSRLSPQSVVRGEQHGNAKLTTADVVAIQHDVQAGHLQREVAARYRTSQSWVSRLVRAQAWRHLQEKGGDRAF